MVRSRLAPTPSGYLHAGNAINFLLTEALVRRANGHLHLRIDDLDRARVRPAYLADIFDTLAWLELRYDSGPRDVADFAARWSQLHRLPRYEALLQRLAAVPDLVYACTCSRAAAGPDGRYPGTCRARGLPLNTPGAAWRVRVPAETEISFSDALLGSVTLSLTEAMGDFVIRKKDGLPAYQVASLADDVADQMTLLVRGQDLLPSTAAQLWLAGQAGPPYDGFRQSRFWHHSLLLDAAGHKLSKSQQTPLTQLALPASGLTPAGLRAQALRLLTA